MGSGCKQTIFSHRKETRHDVQSSCEACSTSRCRIYSELLIQNGWASWAEIIAKGVWQTDHSNSDLFKKVLLYIQKWILPITGIGELSSQLENNHCFWCQERSPLRSCLRRIIACMTQVAGGPLLGTEKGILCWRRLQSVCPEWT